MKVKKRKAKRTSSIGRNFLVAFLISVCFIYILFFVCRQNKQKLTGQSILKSASRHVEIEKVIGGALTAATGKKEAPTSTKAATAVEPTAAAVKATATGSPNFAASGGRDNHAKIAIIIDDIGNNLSAAQPFLQLDAPVTLAILPGLAHSKDIAQRAEAAGLDVLLHLPMEPKDKHKAPGHLAVTTKMSEEEIRQTVEGALETVPGAIGISNHMGSKATEDAEVIEVVLRVAKEHNLFFIDNKTTSNSVIRRVGESLAVPVFSRQKFLDNKDTTNYIKAQISALAYNAKNYDLAIGVAHARAHTAKAVAEMLPKLSARGVKVVPLRELLH